VIVIALVLIYMVTAATFESLLQPLCVILTVPMALRTLRTSVGTMRWRIKFMVVGLVLFFAVFMVVGLVLFFAVTGIVRGFLHPGPGVLQQGQYALLF
jgi:multidrug efflux pump subunit AcrB